MAVEFNEREVEWTHDFSNRFWNYLSRQNVSYFSNEVGRGILRTVRRAAVPLKGRILDFGCGRGHFLSVLASHKIACEGVDFSSSSVDETKALLRDQPSFRGAVQIREIPTQFDSGQFDVIFCIETIEHITGDALLCTFQELHRLLKSGGHLIVTTPNEECLDQSKTICPQCGLIFHHMQHVRSWSVETITAFLNPIGFACTSCMATCLDNSRLWSLAKRLSRQLRGEKFPHLVYVGRKI